MFKCLKHCFYFKLKKITIIVTARRGNKPQGDRKHGYFKRILSNQTHFHKWQVRLHGQQGPQKFQQQIIFFGGRYLKFKVFVNKHNFKRIGNKEKKRNQCYPTAFLQNVIQRFARQLDEYNENSGGIFIYMYHKKLPQLLNFI